MIDDDSEPATSGSDDFCCKRGHSAILPSTQSPTRARSAHDATRMLNAPSYVWSACGESGSATTMSAGHRANPWAAVSDHAWNQFRVR